MTLRLQVTSKYGRRLWRVLPSTPTQWGYHVGLSVDPPFGPLFGAVQERGPQPCWRHFPQVTLRSLLCGCSGRAPPMRGPSTCGGRGKNRKRPSNECAELFFSFPPGLPLQLPQDAPRKAAACPSFFARCFWCVLDNSLQARAQLVKRQTFCKPNERRKRVRDINIQFYYFLLSSPLFYIYHSRFIKLLT